MYREACDAEVGLSCEELGIRDGTFGPAIVTSGKKQTLLFSSYSLGGVIWTSGGSCTHTVLQDQLLSLSTNQEEQRVEFRVRLRHFEDDWGEVWSQALDAAPPLEMKRLITFASQGWEPHG